MPPASPDPGAPDGPLDVPSRPHESARRLSRRRFLAAAGVAGAGLALAPSRLMARSLPGPAPTPPIPAAATPAALGARPAHHIAWVWQFAIDGSRELIRARLAEHGLGIALKTHDGFDWMSEHDENSWAVSGPNRVAELAEFFEDGGVPFHAWCVVKGHEPVREARMAAQVLEAGARSIFLDLEAHVGFWDGNGLDAIVYGAELRRLAPDAFVSTSVDPRPWQIDLVPMEEFAAFSDELAPQVYWSLFSNQSHLDLYAREGLSPISGGIDGSFILAAAMTRLQRFGLPIHPIGDGPLPVSAGWHSFVDGARAVGAESISTFRFGNSDPGVFALLRDTAPSPGAYSVAPGDTLSALARRWSTSVADLAALNGIEHPDLIAVGQRLIVPGQGRAGRTWRPARASTAAISSGTTRAAGSALAEAPPPPAPPPPSASASGGTYTVQPGDSLSGIAAKLAVSLQALIDANGITDPNLIYVGQVLTIP
jgi:LysM repeat protein